MAEFAESPTHEGSSGSKQGRGVYNRAGIYDLFKAVTSATKFITSFRLSLIAISHFIGATYKYVYINSIFA